MKRSYLIIASAFISVGMAGCKKDPEVVDHKRLLSYWTLGQDTFQSFDAVIKRADSSYAYILVEKGSSSVFINYAPATLPASGVYTIKPGFGSVFANGLQVDFNNYPANYQIADSGLISIERAQDTFRVVLPPSRFFNVLRTGDTLIASARIQLIEE
jgi:hypothetical protein